MKKIFIMLFVFALIAMVFSYSQRTHSEVFEIPFIEMNRSIVDDIVEESIIEIDSVEIEVDSVEIEIDSVDSLRQNKKVKERKRVSKKEEKSKKEELFKKERAAKKDSSKIMNQKIMQQHVMLDLILKEKKKNK